eukprot:snap_masked-scaffold989_size72935-processed-gene-0.0 protein:Tk08548 transcript:snap_masked-scaffold989_size72935-processed-gene-0.0-mRNA-1 annotation:"mitochondrial isoprenyl diphosphate synthase precursor"
MNTYVESIKSSNKDEARPMMALFPDLVRELTVEGPHKDVPLISKHLMKCIQYTVPTGKKNRGLAVANSYQLLKPDGKDKELAYIVGWCVEFLQGFFLIADDIMDNADTRRGKPAWYKHENHGLAAFNDAIMVETCIYTLLKNHAQDKPYYHELVEEFRVATRQTAVGQCLDLLTANDRTPDGLINLEAFDMKRYSAIGKFKTSYYSFYLPVALAMRMAEIDNPDLFRLARMILLEMGHFFQIQDDYLDVYGNAKVTGKVGSDIEEGKCSWLIVVAMQRASVEQKAILKQCYGVHDPECVAKVKAIYDSLKLPKIYKAFEEESFSDIETHINQLPGGGKILPPKLFHNFLSKIHKRSEGHIKESGDLSFGHIFDPIINHSHGLGGIRVPEVNVFHFGVIKLPQSPIIRGRDGHSILYE